MFKDMNLYIITILFIVLFLITNFVTDTIKAYKYIEVQRKSYTKQAKVKMALCETSFAYLIYIPVLIMATVISLFLVYAFKHLFIA